ncbi:hypothetical protein ACQP1W_32250 [Spirillospora sp. CA-255316]
MSFDTPRHAGVSTDQPMPTGERRSFLTALDESVRERGGMSCGIVPRSGTPVLHVINSESPRRSTEVGADFADSAWWFTWAQTGDTIGTVDDLAGVTDLISIEVGASDRQARAC